jgi:Glycosyl hydrolase catalytic core
MSVATATNLKVVPGVESLVVSWDLSGEGLGGWLLHYRAKGFKDWTTVELKSTVRSYAITGLPVEGFEIQVRALVAGGLASTTATPLARPLEPPPVEPPLSKLVVGVDIGGWGGSLLTQLASGGIKHVRISSGGRASELAKAGLTPATISFGAGGTVAGRNPQTYAQEFLAVAKANPLCPRLEVLNEPELMGTGKEYSAYVALLKACREAINTLPVAQRPLILSSWAPTYGFGMACAKLGSLTYVDEVVVHAYGGSSGQHKGLEGGRELIEQAHRESRKPVSVTEIGWPTAVGKPSTGDSQQWSEDQQAKAITNFVAWARTQPYIPLVVYFNAVDYGTNDWYGICHSDLSHKPSFATLAQAAQ